MRSEVREFSERPGAARLSGAGLIDSEAAKIPASPRAAGAAGADSKSVASLAKDAAVTGRCVWFEQGACDGAGAGWCILKECCVAV
jgi:hypothetical protein